VCKINIRPTSQWDLTGDSCLPGFVASKQVKQTKQGQTILHQMDSPILSSYLLGLLGWLGWLGISTHFDFTFAHSLGFLGASKQVKQTKQGGANYPPPDGLSNTFFIFAWIAWIAWIAWMAWDFYQF
jgi:hypothetical protein